MGVDGIPWWLREASVCNARDPGSIPGSGRSPGEGNGNPLQYSCLENFHGWRNLVGHSPSGRKESRTTERFHFTSLHGTLLPCGSDGKVSACNAGKPGFNLWVGKIPWRRKWQPTPVLLPREFHGLRSLVGYSPWS